MSSDTDSIDYFDASEGGSHGSNESVLISSRYLRANLKIDSPKEVDAGSSTLMTNDNTKIQSDASKSPGMSSANTIRKEQVPPLATISEHEYHDYDVEPLPPPQLPSAKADSESDDENSSVSTAASSLMKRLSHAFSSFHSISTDQEVNDPSVLRVVPVRKSLTEFRKMRIFQELPHIHRGPVWKIKFSHDGKYVATAGQDNKLIIWSVGINSMDDAHGGDIVAADPAETKTTTTQQQTFISPTPHRIFNEHSNDIVDIDWSRMNFLLSASLDKTVRLWHISSFPHPDFVTSVEFHPLRPRYFVTGCLDRKIRVWDLVPEGRLLDWVEVPDMVTSTRYSPDGQFIVAGLYHGQVFIYRAEPIKYYTQINAKNRHGKYKMGRKVTGLSFIQRRDAYSAISEGRNAAMSNDLLLLVTTNDSRLRLYQLSDFSLVCKFKGLKNTTMQIRASPSPNGEYIISGSEAGGVFIWRIPSLTDGVKLFRKCVRCSSFDVFSTRPVNNVVPIVTVAIFVPSLVVNVARIQNPLLTTRNDYVFDKHSAFIISAEADGKIKIFNSG